MSDINFITGVNWHSHNAVNHPSEDGEYLVITKKSGWLTTLDFTAKVNKFCYNEEDGDCIEVAYWAEIPNRLIEIQQEERKKYVSGNDA